MELGKRLLLTYWKEWVNDMTGRRFDQNNNRVDYGELLLEDTDYELDQAVGMTYSLDLEALMGIPLCLGMGGEMTSGQRNNPLYVLEAIRRTGKKLSIFCNVGCIKVPKTESKLFALLEDSIHEVRMPKSSYNFHPKLWILQYHNVHDGRILIKVVTMSRNLTFDQSMDMAVEMTGFVRKVENEKNRPLADILKFVAQFSNKKKQINSLIDNVKKVEKFDLLDCFDDYAFHSFGIYGKSQAGIKGLIAGKSKQTARELFSNCYALMVISPFLSEGVICDLLKSASDESAGPTRRCLITRETSVTRKIYETFEKNEGDGVWIMDPVLSSNDALEDNDTYGFSNRDIHAKVYYTEKCNEPHKLYLGSLNSSYNAFEYNVEFLLELSYKKYHSSYSSVRDDFIPEKDSPFIRMEKFIEEHPKEDSTVDFKTEIYSLSGAKVLVNGDAYIIKVFSKDDYKDVMIHPFFTRKDKKVLEKETSFEGLSLTSLSNMFILTKDGAESLIRLEVEGMPDVEREDAIFNEIISNKPMFLTYMRYLLDEDIYQSISFEEFSGMNENEGDRNEGYGFSVELDIYEKMLKAAADYPERFDSMYEVVCKIDDEKIGNEFMQLLELFMKAAGKKGRKHK